MRLPFLRRFERKSVPVHGLLSEKRVGSFGQLLSAYRKAGISLYNAIDGGAGMGSTSRTIAQYLEDDDRVFAFEPFPGNHRFFSQDEKAIRLIPKALAESEKRMAFHVSHVVQEDSPWGRRGWTGYSSAGHLVDGSRPARRRNVEGTTFDVDCVAADAVVPGRVGFVKLDLQGGELNALRGMPRILNEVQFMWIEYTGRQSGLLDFLRDSEFELFDTEYCFRGSPTEAITRVFEISKNDVVLSTGKSACFGFRRNEWNDFESEFTRFKQEHHLMQTDLVCVNNRFSDNFRDALLHV